MLVTIQELPITHMALISEELLLHKEITTRTDHPQGILKLYQTQIDHHCYLLIKEPFTHTLAQHLNRTRDLAHVTLQLQHILEDMQAMGFKLRRLLKMEDLLLVFGELKIQHAGVFTLDRQCARIDIEQAVG